MQFDLDFSGRLPASAQLGMKQADDNADPQWKHIWDACVLAAARKKEFVTSDEVLTEFEALPRRPTTHNLSAIGPAMKRAQEMGILIATNEFVRSQREEKKGNLHRLWKSNYWKRKVMSAKIHLMISVDPVPDGLDQRALCGDTVPKASAIPLAEMDQPSSTITFCRECFGKNYFYAITTGQEAKDIEDAA